MYEQNVEIGTGHGRKMEAFTVCPSAEGQWPLILFYMDAPGFREELKTMARRIAKAGYYVILPDLYYRLGHIRFDIPHREETMSAVIKPCIARCRDQSCPNARCRRPGCPAPSRCRGSA